MEGLWYGNCVDIKEDESEWRVTYTTSGSNDDATANTKRTEIPENDYDTAKAPHNRCGYNNVRPVQGGVPNQRPHQTLHSRKQATNHGSGTVGFHRALTLWLLAVVGRSPFAPFAFTEQLTLTGRALANPAPYNLSGSAIAGANRISSLKFYNRT
ncbi:hypothetical protein BDR03DRAFT_987424 [Suillus americanus]|nr:hypothetical protein BDR03DRAFT_987424 [Suillus americanus]